MIAHREVGSLVPAGRRIEAVLFDLDGTLICSEDRTDAAVLALLAEQGIDRPSGFDLSHFHGVTWASTVRPLVERWPVLEGVDVGDAEKIADEHRDRRAPASSGRVDLHGHLRVRQAQVHGLGWPRVLLKFDA